MSTSSWEARAACSTRLELPWIAEPVRLTGWDVEAMRAVCAGCPVMADCATTATELEEGAGWWAGKHQDPEYVEPPAPSWVPVAVGSLIEQGHLPLIFDGAA